MNEASSKSCSKVMYMLSPPLRKRREKKYAPSGEGSNRHRLATPTRPLYHSLVNAVKDYRKLNKKL